MMEFYDASGRKILISREEFKAKVVQGNLEENFNNPEGLYTLALNLIEDNFLEEANQAADRLMELSERGEQSLVLKAVILLKEDKIDEAEVILKECLDNNPQSAYGLTNLAKVYAFRQDEDKAREILLQSLRFDPNQVNGLDWYVAMFLDQGKDKEAVQALKILAEIPAAWRPQLLAGRILLAHGEARVALDYFKESIEKSRKDQEVVAIVSGELGSKGLVAEAAAICEANWDPKAEVPYVGLNLSEAYAEMGKTDEALTVLRRMLPNVAPPFKEMVRQKISALEEMTEA